MSDRDINYLLKQYEKAYVKGEARSNRYQKQVRDESTRKNRHLLLDELILEGRLNLTKDQKQVCRYFIDDFTDDFKYLHRKAKDETILLSFIFYTMKLKNPSIRLMDYTICKTYELSNPVFEIILCRMMLHFIEQCPIKPRQYNKEDHDVLVREGRR